MFTNSHRGGRNRIDSAAPRWARAGLAGTSWVRCNAGARPSRHPESDTIASVSPTGTLAPTVRRRIWLLCASGALSLLLECAKEPSRSSMVATGGSGLGGASAGGGAGGAGGAGGVPLLIPHCTTESDTLGPTASTDCRVTARTIDPMFTCGGASCAVTKALDLTCDSAGGLRPPTLAAAADGAAVFFETTDAEWITVGRLFTIAGAVARVEDFTLLHPGGGIRVDDGIALTSSGKPWLFAWDATELTGARKTDGGWRTTSVASALASNGGMAVTGIKMVNERLGYLTCAVEDYGVPHLLTFDGSCWSDQIIADRGPSYTTLATDGQQRPWVAMAVRPTTVNPDGHLSGGDRWALNIRNPDGGTEDAFAGLPTSAALNLLNPLRFIVSGGDGAPASPLAAMRSLQAIHVFWKGPGNDTAWTSRELTGVPLNPTVKGNCPSSDKRWFDPREDPCLGLSSCNATMTGSSSGFDVVRTQSGATFVAWIDYATEGTYSLGKFCVTGEGAFCYCGIGEIGGAGTAELVIARFGDSEPVLSRFRFDKRRAGLETGGEVVMAARGETLLIVAPLGSWTYVEIDSTALP